MVIFSYDIICTVEPLEFVVDLFSWYLWIALPHKFKSLMKTILERIIFVTEIVTDASTKLHLHD